MQTTLFNPSNAHVCSYFLEFQCLCFDCNRLCHMVKFTFSKIFMNCSRHFFSFSSPDKWNKIHVFVRFILNGSVVRFVYVIFSVPSFVLFFVFIFSSAKLIFYILFHINIRLIELNNVDVAI